MQENLILSDSDSRYQQCAFSVMDNIADNDIVFDENGICNYYHEYKANFTQNVITGPLGTQNLNEIVDRIKEEGKLKKYDCIIGISGGVDSTYLALLTKKLGLRPLAVHLDNNWNSELAVMNIHNVVTKLGFDLYTHVINWEEFKDLQIAYLKASVVDIEVISDHAIFGILFKIAGEKNIKHILIGNNIKTETTLPRTWAHPNTDHINIMAIQKQFGTVPLKTFPLMGDKIKRYYQEIKGVKNVSILNYIEFNKAEVKQIIKEELDWRDYGSKHYENIWTRFFQGYILPYKFKIDKRKAHLSDLIFGGQITKQDALEELKKPIYDPDQFKVDYAFVLKKLGLTDEEFRNLLDQPPQSHYQFDYEKPLDERYSFLKPLKKLYRWIFPIKNNDIHN